MQRLKQPKMNVNSLKKKLILYEQILNWLEVILKSTEKKNEVILTVDSWPKLSRPEGPVFLFIDFPFKPSKMQGLFIFHSLKTKYLSLRCLSLVYVWPWFRTYTWNFILEVQTQRYKHSLHKSCLLSISFQIANFLNNSSQLAYKSNQSVVASIIFLLNLNMPRLWVADQGLSQISVTFNPFRQINLDESKWISLNKMIFLDLKGLYTSKRTELSTLPRVSASELDENRIR